ncbi:hypothetical protein DFQ14_1288 [Halopolyspora algeriensis]|uniref:Uncharacterized protein n=1 Tax=Halopolyspora algeriensis TaxID=1500506 RepID=A0A368VAY7_9ACTN|nr:hypothetical protein [Halopolyspora algeriensis]RCW37480.1 hypothetical protein DFQ14_1288 [Halopolyspora algeriensis]TQM42572.1 hypothetical protein FHU43_4207 [Halopolyspora algeriensis]
MFNDASATDHLGFFGADLSADGVAASGDGQTHPRGPLRVTTTPVEQLLLGELVLQGSFGPQQVAEDVPESLPALACEVCGHRFLRELERHEWGMWRLLVRLECQVCGAHRVVDE